MRSLGIVLLVLGSSIGCQSVQRAGRPSPCASTEAVILPVTVYQEKKVDVPAVPVGGMKALQEILYYPRELRRERIQGRIEVDVIVDALGCVVQTTIAQGGHPDLEAEAAKAMQITRFEPAQKDGVSVASKQMIPITFRSRQVLFWKPCTTAWLPASSISLHRVVWS